MEPQLTTQWLRLNHTFVSICREQLEKVLAQEPSCLSAHIFDIDQSELVRVNRPTGWQTSSDELLNWLKAPQQGEGLDQPEKVVTQGEGISQYTIVGPSTHQTYLIEVPMFNLPIAVSLIWPAEKPPLEAKKVAREAVTGICESYLSTLLNIPLVQEILQQRKLREETNSHYAAI